MWNLPTDKTWKYYGKKSPYYGVFGQEIYLNDNLNDQILNDFFLPGSPMLKIYSQQSIKKLTPDLKQSGSLTLVAGRDDLSFLFQNIVKKLSVLTYLRIC